MGFRFSSHAIFALAAAVVGAAAIDPIVEHLSNAGVFGAGSFTDHSNVDVIPALLVALSLSAVFLSGLVRRMLSRACYAPQWLRRSSHALDGPAVRKLLPAIFIIQMATLFAMETLEQIAVAGHPMGALVWLGGPALISIAMHAGGCALATWMLSRILHWSAQTLVEVVSFVRRLLYAALGDRSKPHVRRLDVSARLLLEPYLARVKGRAPPRLFA